VLPGEGRVAESEPDASVAVIRKAIII